MGLAELQAMYNNATNGKRKAEQDYHSLHEEIEELENEAKAADDKAVKAVAEVSRLMSELNSAHDATASADKSRALMAKQVAELQAQLEESESGGGRGMKNQIRKLEGRIMELERDMNTELKNMRLAFEEAEANNSMLQSKYKKAACEL